MSNAVSVLLLSLAAVVVPAGMLYHDAGPERLAQRVAKDGAIVLVSSERLGISTGAHGHVYRWRIYDYTYGGKAYEVSERDPTPVEPDTHTEPATFEQRLRRVDPQHPGYLVVRPPFESDWWIAHLVKTVPLGLFIAMYAFMAARAMRKGRPEPA